MIRQHDVVQGQSAATSLSKLVRCIYTLVGHGGLGPTWTFKMNKVTMLLTQPATKYQRHVKLTAA